MPESLCLSDFPALCQSTQGAEYNGREESCPWHQKASFEQMDVLWEGQVWAPPEGPRRLETQGGLPLGLCSLGEVQMAIRLPLGRASGQLAVQAAGRSQGHSPVTQTPGHRQGSLFWREGQTEGQLLGLGGGWELESEVADTLLGMEVFASGQKFFGSQAGIWLPNPSLPNRGTGSPELPWGGERRVRPRHTHIPHHHGSRSGP